MSSTPFLSGQSTEHIRYYVAEGGNLGRDQNNIEGTKTISHMMLQTLG